MERKSRDIEMGSMPPYLDQPSDTRGRGQQQLAQHDDSPLSSRANSPTPVMGVYGAVRHGDIEDDMQSLMARTRTGQAGRHLDPATQRPTGHTHARMGWRLPPWLRQIVNILLPAAVLAIPVILFATVFSGTNFGGIEAFGFFVWLLGVWLGLWAAHFLAKCVPMAFKLLFGTTSPRVAIYYQVLVRLPFPIALVAWTIAAEESLVPVVSLWTVTNEAVEEVEAAEEPAAQNSPVPEWILFLRLVLRGLIIVTVLILVERFVINLVAANYKFRQLEERGHNNRRNTRLLRRLYAKAVQLFPPFEEATPRRLLALDWTIETGKERVEPDAIRADLKRTGGQVRDAVGQWANDVVGSDVLEETRRPGAVVRKALEYEGTSRALGKRIFHSFVGFERQAMSLADLRDRFAGDDDGTELEKIFAILDNDDNGDLTSEEMEYFCISVGEERRSLDGSVLGIDSAVDTLDRFLQFILVIAAVLILGSLFSNSFSMYLTMVGAQVIALSFAVSRTVYEILSSCIFVFVKHPYDVGDRVDVDGQALVVDKISLLYTVFRRVGKGRRVQLSNMTLSLSNLWIENVTRSGSMSEVVEIEIDNETTVADMNTLQELLAERLRLPENRRDFQDDLSLELLELGGLGKFQLRFSVTHKSNWSHEQLRRRRRNKLMAAMIASIRQVPIFGSAGWRPPLGTQFRPQYQVQVTKDMALEEQSNLKKDMKEKRYREAVDVKDDEELIRSFVGATGRDVGKGNDAVRMRLAREG